MNGGCSDRVCVCAVEPGRLRVLSSAAENASTAENISEPMHALTHLPILNIANAIRAKQKLEVGPEAAPSPWVHKLTTPLKKKHTCLRCCVHAVEV